MGYNLKSSFPKSESKAKVINISLQPTYQRQQNLKKYCYNFIFHSEDLYLKHSNPMSKAVEEEILKTCGLKIEGSWAWCKVSDLGEMVSF